MIECLHSVAEARARARGLSSDGRRLGLVPTMGALHEGHLSLIRRSRAENDATVVSIFVNPTQFDDPADLAGYARRHQRDLAMAASAGADLAFVPAENDLYPDGYRYRVTETRFACTLEGAHRPGHFDGVLTVVLKLLNIFRPGRAYFGEKDWQQLQLVRDMVAAFFLDTRIVACPTVREDDGLALSSRNERLAPDQRQLAPLLYRALGSAKSEAEITRDLECAGFVVDYIERCAGRRLGAVRLGAVRLIDNVES
ncbi:MAG: pantoate--beta-alanine ligase [Wenzhouxiangella sp.]